MHRLRQVQDSIEFYTSNNPRELSPDKVRRIIEAYQTESTALTQQLETLRAREPRVRRIREIIADIQRFGQIRQEQNLPGQRARIDAAVRSLHDEYNRLATDLWGADGMGGGRIVNSHAKRTGALMRKHRLTLGEASRRAAAHAKSKKKAKKGKGRSGRTTRVR